MADTATERSLGELFASATRDLSALVRNEIELAKLELQLSMQRTAVGVAMFAAAAFLAVVAFILLSFAAVYGLNNLGLGLAWCFLIVTGVYLLIAAIMILVGRSQLKKVGPPQRAIDSTKDSIEALKGSPAEV
jgi:hypothetical protein